MNQQTAVIFTQIVDRPARKLILRQSKQADNYYAYTEEVGCGKNNLSAPWKISFQFCIMTGGSQIDRLPFHIITM